MKNVKSILLINQYATNVDEGYAGRSFYIAKQLSSDFDVHLVIGSHHHMNNNKNKQNKLLSSSVCDGFRITKVRTFDHEKSNSIFRIINWFVFLFGLVVLLIKEKTIFSNIVYSSPSLPAFLGAYLFKVKNKAKLILDIRDIWPLTIKKLANLKSYHPLVILLRFFEVLAYRLSDHIISNLEFFPNYLQKSKPFTWIPNGINLDEVSNPKELDDEYFAAIPDSGFVIGYTGALGKVNCIANLIEAAKLLNNKNIYIVIVGSGKDLNELKLMSLGLDNVLFLPSVKKNQVQSVLSRFDCCYLGWLNDPLYKYGIAPNKLPEYMYSQTPVLHAFSGNSNFVSKSNCGYTVSSEDSNELASMIDFIASSPIEELEILGKNGKEYVLENLTYDKITEKLICDVLRLD